MQKKINSKGFVSHAIFRALSVFTLVLSSSVLIDTFISSSVSALPSISVSSDSNVTIIGDDTGGYVAPSASGSLGVGLDHVNVTTDCSAGYKLYVSGTNSGTTDLVRTDAEDPADTTNRIPTSATAVGSENFLAKNTWGVGKNGSLFAKLQNYSSDSSLWTPLYTGTDSNTFDVYYGLNISTDKQPGIYTADVLYTAVLDDACMKYTLNFDTSSATTVDTSVFAPRSVYYNSNVDLYQFSEPASISKLGYTLTGWKYTIGSTDYEYDIHYGANINPTDATSITLSPVWTPITYNLIYSAGETGATCEALSVPVNYDADVTLSNVICTKLGYTQDGWSSSSSLDNDKDYDLSQTLEKPNFTDIAGASYTLYPHFTINSHTLTVDVNAADTAKIASVSPETGEVEYNTPITAVCTPNSGYYCTGWTSSAPSLVPDSSTTEYDFNMPDSDITLTATASANTYTIRYNANGGTGTTESQTGAAYGSTTTLRESGFSRSGHHFVGWAYSDTAEEPDFTGGQTGVSVTALAENNAAGSVVDTNGGTIDLYAVWSGNNYTFVFDTNGGTGSPASASSSASYDGTIIPPGVGTMEKTNYEFIGWSLSSTSTTEDYTANTTYNASTIVNAAGKATEDGAEITLYAVWSGLPFTLRTVNGNTTAVSSISPDTSGTTKRYGSSVTVSCTPNSGYHCTGWTSSDTSILPSSSNASYTFNMPGDITLTANGAPNTYTIRYNANGGSGSTASQTGQTYGSTTTLQSNGFSKNGYYFVGWAYSSSSSSANFNGGQSNVSVSTLAGNNASGSVVDTNGGTIDLYAVWAGNSYTIAYSAGSTGGSCSVSSTSAVYGQSVSLSSSKCSKSGYHQDGWSTSSSSSNTKTYNLGQSVSNLTTSGTTYLYPHFVANTYTIKYTSYGAPRYSHTANISDDGSQSGQYGNDLNTNEVITVSGASKLRITLTYQTESTSYDWVSFWAGNYPSYTALNNYSSGVKLGSNTDGKYGGTTKTTVEGVINGNTVTFGFRSDSSVANYGYYAVITPLDSSGNPLANVTGSTASQTATYGNNVTLRSNGFSRSGYSFNGWTFSENTSSGSYSAGSSYSVATLASDAGVTNTDGGVILLYAAWQQQTTYRTLTLNAGSCISSTSGGGSKVVGNPAYISASASTGCHFDYWTVNSGGASLASYYNASTSFTMPDNNVTITANGAYNTYTIAYNANGGSGSTSSQTGQSYSSSVTLRDNGFYRAYYAFKGWSLSSSATYGSYNPGSSISVSNLASSAGVASTNGATITLYAVWEQATASFQQTGSCAHITPGSSGYLYDSRDNQAYEVYRWPITGTAGINFPSGMAGRCIMAQDLALGNVTGGSVTKNSNLSLTTSESQSSGTVTARTQASSWDTSNTSSNLQYVNGGGSTYYSAPAATKVCPKGWTMPTYTQYSDIATVMGNPLNSPYKYRLGGYFSSGGWTNNTNYGYYWSNTSPSSSNQRYLYISSAGGYNTSDYMGKNYGMLIRCINSASPTMQTFDTSVITPGTTGWLRDSRDNQWYSVYRFPTSGSYPGGMSGTYIMTQDLSLGYVTGGSITRDSNLSLTTDDSQGKATITAKTGTSWSTTDSNSNRQYKNGSGGTYDSHTYYSYGAAQAVCPANWHLPSQLEYSYIATFMGGNNITASNTIRNNPYNFVNGGFYSGSSGWLGVGTSGYYWSSSASDSTHGYHLHFPSNGLYTTTYFMNLGMSVRCLSGSNFSS